jgi:hypothetical protein
MSTIRLSFVLAALVITPAASSPAQEPGPDAPGVVRSLTSAGTVDFPHALHASDFEIECVTCHHETSAAALAMPHEKYFEDFWIDCGTCHRAGAAPGSPQTCSACHHSSPATIADESLSAKVVIHKSCLGCHEGGTGRDAARSCGFCHQTETPAIFEGEDEDSRPGENQHG